MVTKLNSSESRLKTEAIKYKLQRDYNSFQQSMIPGMGSFIIFLLLFVSSVNGIEYSHTELLDGEAYKAHWRFNNETAIFYFKVEVNASGWLGFGVSKLLFPPFEGLEWNRKSMDHYDVIVGGVDSGTEYYKASIVDRVVVEFCQLL